MTDSAPMTPEVLARLLVKHLGAVMVPLHCYVPDLPADYVGPIDPIKHNARIARERAFMEERAATILAELRPTTLGLAGVIEESHQEGAVRVIDQLRATSAAVLPGSTILRNQYAAIRIRCDRSPSGRHAWRWEQSPNYTQEVWDRRCWRCLRWHRDVVAR